MAKKPVRSASPRIRRSSTSSRTATYRSFGSPMAKPCDGEGFPVEVISSCEEPVYVELCAGSLGIETAMAQLGCIVDEEGIQIGVVMVCKITDESTGEETLVPKAFYEDGTIEDNYTGEWTVCAPDVCQPEEPIGVITDLTLLTA